MTEPLKMRDPTAVFKGDPNGATVLDFWRWSGSDLLDNAQRGIVAEFLVAQALGAASEPRREWEAYDILYKDRYKIEVKSTAYVQAWEQDKAYHGEYKIEKRTADIYVLSLLHHKNKKYRRDTNCPPNPLDLDHWEFAVLHTNMLPNQKTIRPNPLRTYGPDSAHGIPYGRLRAMVDRACEALG